MHLIHDIQKGIQDQLGILGKNNYLKLIRILAIIRKETANRYTWSGFYLACVLFVVFAQYSHANQNSFDTKCTNGVKIRCIIDELEWLCSSDVGNTTVDFGGHINSIYRGTWYFNGSTSKDKYVAVKNECKKVTDIDATFNVANVATELESPDKNLSKEAKIALGKISKFSTTKHYSYDEIVKTAFNRTRKIMAIATKKSIWEHKIEFVKIGRNGELTPFIELVEPQPPKEGAYWQWSPHQCFSFSDDGRYLYMSGYVKNRIRGKRDHYALFRVEVPVSPQKHISWDPPVLNPMWPSENLPDKTWPTEPMGMDTDIDYTAIHGDHIAMSLTFRLNNNYRNAIVVRELSTGKTLASYEHPYGVPSATEISFLQDGSGVFFGENAIPNPTPNSKYIREGDPPWLTRVGVFNFSRNKTIHSEALSDEYLLDESEAYGKANYVMSTRGKQSLQFWELINERWKKDEVKSLKLVDEIPLKRVPSSISVSPNGEYLLANIYEKGQHIYSLMDRKPVATLSQFKEFRESFFIDENTICIYGYQGNKDKSGKKLYYTLYFYSLDAISKLKNEIFTVAEDLSAQEKLRIFQAINNIEDDDARQAINTDYAEEILGIMVEVIDQNLGKPASGKTKYSNHWFYGSKATTTINDAFIKFKLYITKDSPLRSFKNPVITFDSKVIQTIAGGTDANLGWYTSLNRDEVFENRSLIQLQKKNAYATVVTSSIGDITLATEGSTFHEETVDIHFTYEIPQISTEEAR
jgi:hypothetical protein